MWPDRAKSFFTWVIFCSSLCIFGRFFGKILFSLNELFQSLFTIGQKVQDLGKDFSNRLVTLKRSNAEMKLEGENLIRTKKLVQFRKVHCQLSEGHQSRSCHWDRNGWLLQKKSITSDQKQISSKKNCVHFYYLNIIWTLSQLPKDDHLPAWQLLVGSVKFFYRLCELDSRWTGLDFGNSYFVVVAVAVVVVLMLPPWRKKRAYWLLSYHLLKFL